MIKRVHNVKHANRIANIPEVFKYVKIDGIQKIDLTPYFNRDKDIVLNHPEGTFICFNQGNGVYKCHQQFIRSKSNKIKLLQEAIEYMFTHTDCLCLIGETPQEFRHAALVARRCGFEKVGEKKADWTYEGKTPLLNCYWLTFEKYKKMKGL